jgi:hypothetical protein
MPLVGFNFYERLLCKRNIHFCRTPVPLSVTNILFSKTEIDIDTPLITNLFQSEFHVVSEK